MSEMLSGGIGRSISSSSSAERLLQRPPHALGLGAVQEILARQETDPRIGQRAAERMGAGKDAPPGRIQQVLELGWNGV